MTLIQRTLWTLLATIAFLLVATPDSLHAKEEFQSVEIRLVWQDVEGNRGYALQYQDQKNLTIQELKIQTNQATLNLAPGSYQIRIAALNKFGKPSLWTDWNDLSVTGKQKVQEFTAQKKAPVKAKLWDPAYLVPGLPRLKNGDPRGYAWIGLFTGIAAYGYSEQQAGTSIAHNPMNDPVLLTLLLQEQTTATLLYFRSQRESQKSLYETHQNNQRTAAGLFLVAYALHYWDGIHLSKQRESDKKVTILPLLLPESGTAGRASFAPIGKGRSVASNPFGLYGTSLQIRFNMEF